MHIAILDEELPFPAMSGKRLRTLNLVERLAERHKITYLCHRNEDVEEAAKAAKHFRSLGIDVVMVDHQLPKSSQPSFYLALLGNLFSPLPYSVQSHKSEALRQAVRQLDAESKVDVWHCEWSPYAENLNGIDVKPVVAVAHNVESLIWQRYYEHEKNPLKRWYIGKQWKKFDAFERKMFSEIEHLVTVSQSDADLATSFGASGVSVVDNGVDIDFFQPQIGKSQPNKILFLGALDWRPNQDGVRALFDTVFPAVRKQIPDAELCLVGRRPPQWMTQRAADTPQVSLHADVPDVRPYMAEAGVMAVPLRIGGGSRLKILEAAAFQLPVVSTKIGAEGLSLMAGSEYHEVDGVEQMADSIVTCIKNPAGAKEMAEKARETVVSQYDWPVLADKLETVWMETAKTSPVLAS